MSPSGSKAGEKMDVANCFPAVICNYAFFSSFVSIREQKMESGFACEGVIGIMELEETLWNGSLGEESKEKPLYGCSVASLWIWAGARHKAWLIRVTAFFWKDLGAWISPTTFATSEGAPWLTVNRLSLVQHPRWCNQGRRKISLRWNNLCCQPELCSQ